MFSPMSTFYYWEENREEIYRSAPTRVRVCKRSRLRRGRRHNNVSGQENNPECISHGQTWKERFEQLITSLRGKILAEREDLETELASIACSCDDRDREKCRDAARRLGFIIGSNLPPDEVSGRMRFTELYFHNILNSPQMTEEYMDNISGSEPFYGIVHGLYENRLNISSLVQRCVLNNDLKAYRLLDVIRQYIQKPCQSVVQIPIPEQNDEALEWLAAMDKNDHINNADAIFGCHLMIDTSTLGQQHALNLYASTANIQDIHELQSYFVSPIGIKLKEKTVEAESNQPNPDDNVEEVEKAIDQVEKVQDAAKAEANDSDNKTSVVSGATGSDNQDIVGQPDDKPQARPANDVPTEEHTDQVEMNSTSEIENSDMDTASTHGQPSPTLGSDSSDRDMAQADNTNVGDSQSEPATDNPRDNLEITRGAPKADSPPQNSEVTQDSNAINLEMASENVNSFGGANTETSPR